MIVLIGSHKGGVGKSTKAANIAVAVRHMTKKTIAMVGSDKLGCLKSWYARRQDAGLSSFTFVEAYGDLRKELIELSKRYDIVLVDTAGHDSQEFRSALTVSDILLSPVRPSSQSEIDSIAALTETVRTAQEKHNPSLQAYLVFNRCSSRNGNTDASDLANMLKSDEYWLQPTKQRIGERTVYVKTFNAGQGVHEAKDGQAKGEIELLCHEVGIF